MLRLLHVIALALLSPASTVQDGVSPVSEPTTNEVVEARWAAAWDAPQMPDAPCGPDAGDE